MTCICLITADPYLPVPPLLYGGIERVIDVLVRELVGAATTSRSSRTPTAARRPAWCRTASRRTSDTAIRAQGARAGGRALWRERRDVDVVHSFGRLAALLPILPMRQLPKLQSYQRDGVPWTSVAARSGWPGRR